MDHTYINTLGIMHFKAKNARTRPIVVFIAKTFRITRTL